MVFRPAGSLANHLLLVMSLGHSSDVDLERSRLLQTCNRWSSRDLDGSAEGVAKRRRRQRESERSFGAYTPCKQASKSERHTINIYGMYV